MMCWCGDDGVVPLVPFFIMHALLHNQLRLIFPHTWSNILDDMEEREKKACTGVPLCGRKQNLNYKVMSYFSFA